MDMNKTPYNELGQRKMQFYYPFISYRKYKDDIRLLDEIGNDKYMEMALSFAKLYSVEEVKKMIPEHLITWYWIEDLNTEEKKELEKVNYENRAQDIPEEIKMEDHVYGFKAITSDGIKVDNPEFWFLQSLKKGMKLIDNTSTNSFETENAIVEMKRVYQYLQGEHKEISPNALRIQGVVVTGDKEDLRAIKDLPFIKATSLGVITDKY
ncbi:hypothetical protein COI93_20945 [Bacillus cereus]|uniref:Sigma factor regulator C-terminal domain-containing protein n=2 Tax=Bacillus cereus TaxID=1396 RepID=A0A2B0LAW3_BACCE|nr:hypothetical protein COI93_20945 [Bacillus cereus]